MKKQALILLGILCGIVFGSQAQTYRGMVDVGAAIELANDYIFYLGDVGEGRVCDYGDGEVLFAYAVSTTHGIQINRNHYVGVGVEFTKIELTDVKETFGCIPVYAMWRMDFFGRRVSPFFDVRAGYQVADVSGFYGNINGGIRIALGRRTGLNISAGIRMRRIVEHDFGQWIYKIGPYRYVHELGADIKRTETVFGALIRIGVDF